MAENLSNWSFSSMTNHFEAWEKFVLIYFIQDKLTQKKIWLKKYSVDHNLTTLPNSEHLSPQYSIPAFTLLHFMHTKVD